MQERSKIRSIHLVFKMCCFLTILLKNTSSSVGSNAIGNHCNSSWLSWHHLFQLFKTWWRTQSMKRLQDKSDTDTNPLLKQHHKRQHWDVVSTNSQRLKQHSNVECFVMFDCFNGWFALERLVCQIFFYPGHNVHGNCGNPEYVPGSDTLIYWRTQTVPQQVKRYITCGGQQSLQHPESSSSEEQSICTLKVFSTMACRII